MATEDFKDRLKKALDLRNLKAVDLCEKTKIPKGAVSYYLSGKSTPKADRLYLICKALDVSEAWMLGYDVAMERTETQIKEKPTAVDDGLSDDMKKLIERIKKLPADKVQILLQVAESIK